MRRRCRAVDDETPVTRSRSSAVLRHPCFAAKPSAPKRRLLRCTTSVVVATRCASTMRPSSSIRAVVSSRSSAPINGSASASILDAVSIACSSVAVGVFIPEVNQQPPTSGSGNPSSEAIPWIPHNTAHCSGQDLHLWCAPERRPTDRQRPGDVCSMLVCISRPSLRTAALRGFNCAARHTKSHIVDDRIWSTGAAN